MSSQLLLTNRLKDLVLFKVQGRARVWINDAACDFFRLSDNYVEIETFHQQISNAGLIHVADLQMVQQKFAYADKAELKPSSSRASPSRSVCALMPMSLISGIR